MMTAFREVNLGEFWIGVKAYHLLLIAEDLIGNGRIKASCCTFYMGANAMPCQTAAGIKRAVGGSFFAAGGLDQESHVKFLRRSSFP